MTVPPAAARTRRTVTAVLAVLCALALLGAACTRTIRPSAEPVQPTGPTTTVPYDGAPPCSGPDGVGGVVPAGLGPGDLVDAEPLDDAGSRASTGFPTGARVWRILYVSTVLDETDLQLVCGLVAAPDDGPEVAPDGSAKVFSWAHGTIGLQQACLPSSRPETYFWGPTWGGGLGAVGWGSGSDARHGTEADGLLQWAVDGGWTVVATDYRPVDTYLVGRVAAANVLDAGRAASQLLAASFPARDVARWQQVIAGHSQGGHAAAWAGQLHDAYLAATAPSRPVPPSQLVGVVLEAPASNFVVQPERQPGTALGDGLADREMYQLMDTPVGPVQLHLPIGPALFSYIFGSWSRMSARGAPAPGSELPAFPEQDTDLRLDAVATPQGITTITTVVDLCLMGRDQLRVLGAVQPYHDAARNRMLVPEMWNLPADYRPGQYVIGGVDRTCAGDPSPEVAAWCRWIRWNLPGPLGEHPMPKVANSDGRPVPVLLGTGTDDEVVHCEPAPGDPATVVPPPSACAASALWAALAGAVCPGGSVQQLVFPATGADSPGTHFSIPGQLASAGPTPAGLTMAGSPLQQFLDGAVAGRVPAGCTQRVAAG